MRTLGVVHALVSYAALGIACANNVLHTAAHTVRCPGQRGGVFADTKAYSMRAVAEWRDILVDTTCRTRGKTICCRGSRPLSKRSFGPASLRSTASHINLRMRLVLSLLGCLVNIVLFYITLNS
ncbi:hypothetical protein B0H14DRAFT_2920914 [Mycena olivaceomarginata]|nr:hypothetical protein B0H14DRAFT_2920914 [Mycena olivaceomarginata]